MTDENQIHKVRASVLKSLRRADSVRFNALMKPTGLESDNFKFHIRQLLRSGYIQKNQQGSYQLTAAGKEYANNLDDDRRTTLKQPKLSTVIVASRKGADGDDEYLVQQRLRNPFYGHWGLISGPVLWGEQFDVTAGKELLKQTGLLADFQTTGFVRVRDFADDSLLEDKVFVVLKAARLDGQLSNAWTGGENQWLGLKELAAKEHVFTSSLTILESLDKPGFYSQDDIHHSVTDY